MFESRRFFLCFVRLSVFFEFYWDGMFFFSDDGRWSSFFDGLGIVDWIADKR
jgi:hypothetical protein